MGIRESALQIINSVRSTDKLRVVTTEDNSRSITMGDFMDDAASYFSDVASSGDYDDLSNRPTIPTMTQILLAAHPVGCYMWTSDPNYSPQTEIGGQWEKIDPGVTLVSAGTGYTVQSGTARDGGSEYLQAHKHEFTRPTVNNGGGHSHNGTRRPIYQASGSTTGFVGANTSTADATSARVTREDSQGAHGHTLAGGSVDAVSDLPDGQTTGNAGNMPPYKAAYCWHRIA